MRVMSEEMRLLPRSRSRRHRDRRHQLSAFAVACTGVHRSEPKRGREQVKTSLTLLFHSQWHRTVAFTAGPGAYSERAPHHGKRSARGRDPLDIANQWTDEAPKHVIPLFSRQEFIDPSTRERKPRRIA